MIVRRLVCTVFAFLAGLGASSLTLADDPQQFPHNATFSTLITTPFGIEGLTGDRSGNLYTAGILGSPCPVWRISLIALLPPRRRSLPRESQELMALPLIGSVISGLVMELRVKEESGR
jgi:hypothetical protein